MRSRNLARVLFALALLATYLCVVGVLLAIGVWQPAFVLAIAFAALFLARCEGDELYVLRAVMRARRLARRTNRAPAGAPASSAS